MSIEKLWWPSRSKFYLLATMILMLCACSTNSTKLEKIVELERVTADMRRVQADQSARINALETRVRSLAGLIEEVEYSQSYKIQGDVKSLKDDITSLRKRVPPPAIVPASALEEDEVLAGRLPPEASRIFSNILVKIREGNFREALPIIGDLQRQADGFEWYAQVTFWKGVSYDATGDNKAALAAYNEVVSRYPKGSRAPLALLRQASVFVRLRDSSTAKLTLQKLIAEFPKTNEAAIAKQRLRKL